MNDIDFTQRLSAQFESEYLGCNFDAGNTFIAGHNPLDYFKALRKYAVHFHIKAASPAFPRAALRSAGAQAQILIINADGEGRN